MLLYEILWHIFHRSFSRCVLLFFYQSNNFIKHVCINKIAAFNFIYSAWMCIYICIVKVNAQYMISRMLTINMVCWDQSFILITLSFYQCIEINMKIKQKIFEKGRYIIMKISELINYEIFWLSARELVFYSMFKLPTSYSCYKPTSSTNFVFSF